MSDCRFSCTSCEKYDKEKHSCPVYCDLIRYSMNERVKAELELIKKEAERVNWYNRSDKKGFYTILDRHIMNLDCEIDETYFDLMKELNNEIDN